MAIERGLAYAPYADILWCETSKPDIGEAREFAQGIHAQYPGKLLTYNCSPSFNWGGISTRGKSLASRNSWLSWATNSNLSPWLASIR